MSVTEAEDLLGVRSRTKVGAEIANAHFAPGVRWKPNGVRGLVLENVEWPGAAISGRLFGRGRVQESRFQRVNVDSLRCRKVDFVDCHFDSVTFGEHYFGSVSDCAFERCSFVKCRFDAVGFEESTFRSCRFEMVKGERVRWRHCVIEDVVLSGTLVKTNFISTAFRKVDLSTAEMHDSALVYTKEWDVTLPDRPDNFAIDAQLFLDAESALRSQLTPTSLEAYCRLAKEWSIFGTPFIVDEGVVGDLRPEDRRVVLGVLYEMRHHRPLWATNTSSVR